MLEGRGEHVQQQSDKREQSASLVTQVILLVAIKEVG